MDRPSHLIDSPPPDVADEYLKLQMPNQRRVLTGLEAAGLVAPVMAAISTLELPRMLTALVR